jgi:hypothetical protein
VGGRWIVHHLIYRTQVPGDECSEPQFWPVHEVGRNPDLFSRGVGPSLKAGSQIVSESVHLHSNGIARRGRPRDRLRALPEDYEPKYENARASRLGERLGHRHRPEPGRPGAARLRWCSSDHVKIVSLRAAPARAGRPHVPGGDLGLHIETLSCVGYDHNWVRTYSFAENYQPLLPKGAVLHITGYMNNTESNANVPDPRNWQGSGNRSVSNMFIDLGIQVRMTDEQFVAEMARRREVFDLDVNDHVIGCPLCMAQIPLLPELEEDEEDVAEAAGSEVEASSVADLLGAWVLPLETPQGGFQIGHRLHADVRTGSSPPRSAHRDPGARWTAERIHRSG